MALHPLHKLRHFFPLLVLLSSINCTLSTPSPPLPSISIYYPPPSSPLSPNAVSYHLKHYNLPPTLDSTTCLTTYSTTHEQDHKHQISHTCYSSIHYLCKDECIRTSLSNYVASSFTAGSNNEINVRANLDDVSLEILKDYVTSPELILNSDVGFEVGEYTLKAELFVGGVKLDEDTVEFVVGGEEYIWSEGCGVEVVDGAVEKAEGEGDGGGKFEVEGMSGRKFRVFLNEIVGRLGEKEEVRYLEIGVYKGSTFVSALEGNEVKVGKAWAVDDWSLFGGPKEEFMRNVERFGNLVEVLERDAFNFMEKSSVISDVNVYFFDGPHAYTHHYRSVTDYWSVLADEFIMIVDDFNFRDVKEATWKGIQDMNGTVVGFREVRTGNNDLIEGGERNEWHNGCGIFVVKKWKEEVPEEEVSTKEVKVQVGAVDELVEVVKVERNPLELSQLQDYPTKPFNVFFELNTGATLAMTVYPDWAPHAAAHFKMLVDAGYYDGCSIFRIVPNYFMQFGIHNDPAVTQLWGGVGVEDDPKGVMKNFKGSISFDPSDGPGGGKTQVFVNLSELSSHNERLDGQGMVPFARVIGQQTREGDWQAIESVQKKWGKKVDAKRIVEEGKEYLDGGGFTDLSFIVKAKVM
ncbi:hypothetical protein TrST_g3341 [Triparma strigata]|uniref:PPIase cyclophilin-type domain-containing protein n=1 Tax=Triparma strigata TaxID=1606541 RepID=A0A9W7AFK8_9STRA|nr:hypothetical protein TrST_g3341 [Triparma strigata]